MSKGWDSGKLKKLKALIGKGLSTAEMGKKIGVSKNAVVGKLNRLGWNIKSGEDDKKTTKKKTTKTDSVKKSSKGVKTVVKSGTKKAAVKPVAKKTVKNAKVKSDKIKTVKTPAKPARPVKPTKLQKVEKPVVKTASKKTQKDLALHELLIQHALQMANLKPNQCRWPIGDPDSDNFHFCGKTVFSGKPYCYEHCLQAYQFTAPKKK